MRMNTGKTVSKKILRTRSHYIKLSEIKISQPISKLDKNQYVTCDVRKQLILQHNE